MSKDDSDGNTPSMSRRRVLTATGALGAGALAVPGVASADKSDTDKSATEELRDEKWETEILEEGDEAYKYVGEDSNADPRVFPFSAINRDIVCVDAPHLGRTCLNFIGTVSWQEVSFDVSVAGITLIGGGISRRNSFFSADFNSSTYPVSGSITVNGEWHGGTNVELYVTGELCVGKGPIEVCDSRSVTIAQT